MTAENGVLRIQSTGDDPFMHNPVNYPGGQVLLQLRLRSESNGSGEVFWTSDALPRRSEKQRAGFSFPADGQWHETEVRFQSPGTLQDLRIDPGVQPGLVEIDWIRLVQEELHPLSVSSVEQTSNAVRFLVTNHRDESATVESNGLSIIIPAHESIPLEQSIPGQRPLESVSVTLNCDSWPALVRTVWVVNPACRPSGSRSHSVLLS